MNFSQGHSGTKVRYVNRACFLRKTSEFAKMGEIHELFVLALFLVWFAGATPEILYLNSWGVSRRGVFARGELSIIGVGARTGCNNEFFFFLCGASLMNPI